jgi:hypothetical protein
MNIIDQWLWGFKVRNTSHGQTQSWDEPHNVHVLIAMSASWGDFEGFSPMSSAFIGSAVENGHYNDFWAANDCWPYRWLDNATQVTFVGTTYDIGLYAWDMVTFYE